MSKQMGLDKVGIPVKLILLANLFFWIYFGIAFVHASYPFSTDVWNYTAPTAPAGYTFFGHSIGIRESAFEHGFFRIMFYVEFPSFAVARLGQNVLFPHVTGSVFFAGISEAGWRVLATALISFFQWFFVGLFLDWIRRRLSNRETKGTDGTLSPKFTKC